MSVPGGYILRVPTNRRRELLEYSELNESIGQPVPSFSHTRKTPLLVFASFEDGMITHLADGRKGVASGSGLVRLNLSNIQALHFPVAFEAIRDSIYGRSAAHILKRLEDGGLFPRESFQSFLEVFGTLSSESMERLARFGQARIDLVTNLPQAKRLALAQQKEGVGFALKIGGFDTRELLDWEPSVSGEYDSFLDGMPQARLREDAMVFHDLDHVPGFKLVSSNQTGARVFRGEATKLTVILANKLPLEEQLGSDLIYYNETHKSFVMVQYKAMEQRRSGKPEFRLPNEQLEKELMRMDAIDAEMDKLPDDGSRDGYRLNSKPFFMKLCNRHTFNPDDGGLFPGFYVPVDYWKRLVKDPSTLGPKKGRLVTSENVGRRISDDGFVTLIAGGWVGTSPSQSAVLEKLVRAILVSGKAVVFAIEQKPRTSSVD